MGAVGLRIEILDGLTHQESGANRVNPAGLVPRSIAARRRYRSKAETLLSGRGGQKNPSKWRPEKPLRLGFPWRLNTGFAIRDVFSQIGQLAIKE